MRTASKGKSDAVRTRVAIIGAGFGGLGMAHYLKQAGFEDLTIFEKKGALGGVWRDNTYPGAACDVPSHLYSFSFETGYPWSHRFARQPEILAYQQHCAERHDLLRHIRFGHELTAARFDPARAIWTLSFAGGDTLEADIVVSAVGQLHRPSIPDIPGAEGFAGLRFHSAQWPASLDLSGKRVAVVGTGASAVQFVPEIAPQVHTLHVFQRSPGWVLPMEWVSPGAAVPYSPLSRTLFKAIPMLEALDRTRVFNIAELLATAYNHGGAGEAIIRQLCLRNLRQQVADPVLRDRLTPDFPVGCKRILLTSRWLPALTRDNVEVVTDGIEAITPTGVRTADGVQRDVDVLIYGTGFAATDFLAPMAVTGRDGQDLRGGWQQGAEAYLGMSVAGFPNFFMLYGPNTNVGSGSIIVMLEAQQQYIVQLLQARAGRGGVALDVRPEAQARYNAEIQSRSENTTYAGDCQSWYKTADGRNTNNWVGTMREFRRRTRRPDLGDFAWTPLRPAP